MMDFAQRLAGIQEQIDAACVRSGRDPSEVQLVAVSKTYPPEAVDEAAHCGCVVFGESRIPEAQQKIPVCRSALTWHFIGHLQRNKVRPAVLLFSRIHSVDSLRLLERVESCAEEEGRQVSVCLQVNVSGESSKFGLHPDDVPEVLEKAASLRYTLVDGLMTMAPFVEDPEDARPHFRRLREWRDVWVSQTGWPLDVLSMGMSHDYVVAVEEGATLVRVGTALFGDRPKPVAGDVE